jgi:hypothetical protein
MTSLLPKSYNSETVHLVTAGDKNYLQGIQMTVASALLNMPSNRDVLFHILDGGLSVDNHHHLGSMVSRLHQSCVLAFHDISDILPRDVTVGLGNWPLSSYARIWMGTLISGVDKVIYLDSDTLVLGDLSVLWDVELDDFYALACLDLKISSLGEDTAGPLSENESHLPYINGGVLVADLSKWRESHIERVALDMIKDPDCNYRWFDQTILNYLLRSKVGVISSEWNWIARDFPIGYDFSVQLIHFTNSTKPWNYWGNEFRFQLWRESYRVVFGSPLWMFLNSDAWKGLCYGLFDSAIELVSPLRWIYLGYLKIIHFLSRDTKQKLVLDKKISFLASKRNSASKSEQKIFLKKFRAELRTAVDN